MPLGQVLWSARRTVYPLVGEWLLEVPCDCFGCYQIAAAARSLHGRSHIFRKHWPTTCCVMKPQKIIKCKPETEFIPHLKTEVSALLPQTLCLKRHNFYFESKNSPFLDCAALFTVAQQVVGKCLQTIWQLHCKLQVTTTIH